jgi:lysophospholipase L1-like esterase
VKRLSFAAILLTASLSFAQTSAPASKPVLPPPTPEQKEIIDKLTKESAGADKPSPKYDLAPYNKDGTPNPNFGKVNAGFLAAHEQFMKRKEKPINLLFIGDSITAGWNGGGKKVWQEHYEKLNAANFGIGGDRTQHVLWRIQEGELDGIKPKVVVLMIGTNNSGAPAEEITKGVKAIVDQIHAKLPESKLLLLGIFPRSPKASDPARAKLQAVNAELAKLDDGKQTRYLEIWKQFLTPEGELTKDIMPDALHPNAKGYQIWADTMQPLLDEMMK